MCKLLLAGLVVNHVVWAVPHVAPPTCSTDAEGERMRHQHRDAGSKIENIYIPIKIYILLVTLLIFFRCIMVY